MTEDNELNDRLENDADVIIAYDEMPVVKLADAMTGQLMRELGGAYLAEIADRYGVDVANDLQVFSAVKVGETFDNLHIGLKKEGFPLSDGVIVTAWFVLVYNVLLTIMANLEKLSLLDEINRIEEEFNNE